jgi:hypothetical protein
MLLRSVNAFKVQGDAGKEALDRWIAWAQRCRIPGFVELQRRIGRHRTAIDAALEHGLSQGLIESTNTKLRVLTRIAFGFRSPDALIALAMLALGGHGPSLPGERSPDDPRERQESQLKPSAGLTVSVARRALVGRRACQASTRLSLGTSPTHPATEHAS